jgi:hypothetical protein
MERPAALAFDRRRGQLATVRFMICDGVTSSALTADDLTLRLDDTGHHPVNPLLFIELDDGISSGMVEAVAASRRIVVGVAHKPVPVHLAPLLDALVCTFAPDEADSRCVGVPRMAAAQDALVAAVERSPRAAGALVEVLRVTSAVPVAAGLAAESHAYSMLLAGPEFARWRSGRATRSVPEPTEPLAVNRVGDTLHIRLNQPQRRNAFSRDMRDALVDAFDLVLLDGSIKAVELTGEGAAFCSGGDLDEFGTTTDVGAAHLIRLVRSVASRLDACRERVRVVVHGACIGAGIELPSFASRIEARADAYFQLPEVAMGLIPGAGGTVGITRRIGRWRTAYLALTGERIDRDTALRWGLIDAAI